jgi:hypothetical protein
MFSDLRVMSIEIQREFERKWNDIRVRKQCQLNVLIAVIKATDFVMEVLLDIPVMNGHVCIELHFRLARNGYVYQ